jgi:uncharacterized protein YjbJ (UPF0337 family)
VHKDTLAQRKKRIRAHKDFVGNKPYGTPCAPQGATIQRKPYAAQGSAQARTRPGGFGKESSRKVKESKAKVKESTGKVKESTGKAMESIGKVNNRRLIRNAGQTRQPKICNFGPKR